MNETTKYYTPDEVADMLQIGRQSVYDYVKKGKLKALKVGHRTIRISQENLDEMLAGKNESIVNPIVEIKENIIQS